MKIKNTILLLFLLSTFGVFAQTGKVLDNLIMTSKILGMERNFAIYLFEGNSLMHIDWKKRNIPHEYRVRDGGHTWTYWRDALPEVLHFVSQAFHQY